MQAKHYFESRELHLEGRIIDSTSTHRHVEIERFQRASGTEDAASEALGGAGRPGWLAKGELDVRVRQAIPGH